MSRNVIALWVVLCLLLLGACPVLAETANPTGSITVTLTEPESNRPLVGAQLNLYCVATAHESAEGALLYRYTDDFASLNLPLEDEGLVGALDTYVSQTPVTAVACITDATGTAVWPNLALGLYFVKQTGAVEGFAPCTPFLVTVPGEGDVYDVNASPKTQVEKLVSVTIKKKWNTDAATKATDSVTVQLLRGDTVVETAILNEQNNWQITYPDLPESDAYRIREVDIPKGFTATYQQSGYAFTVTNTPTLIQTGQLLWPVPVLAVGGVLLIAVGTALLRKKRDAHA